MRSPPRRGSRRRAPTGKFGKALRLTGSPIGLAEHVSLPAGVVSGLRDFTIALWINLRSTTARALASPKADPAALTNGTALFDFGSPNPSSPSPPLARMYMTVARANDKPVPRFAITTSGAKGEQRLDGTPPLPIDKWTHIAITRTRQRRRRSTSTARPPAPTPT